MNTHELVRDLASAVTQLTPRADELEHTIRTVIEMRDLDCTPDLLLAVRNETLRLQAGWGPLEGLMDDPDVRDIAVNAPNDVWALRSGGWRRERVAFADELDLLNTAHRLLLHGESGTALTMTSPVVDARLSLPGRPRICAVLPPAAEGSVSLTIRKYRTQRLTMKEMVAAGALSLPMSYLLFAAIQGRVNMLVSGGTGSGKTTFLGALLSLIPSSERLVMIEDTAELTAPEGSNTVRLVADRDEPTRDADALLRASLRMSPTRIIVGEVRGQEALTLLQAMNTGHDGSLGTVHANGPIDVPSRLATLALTGARNLPYEAILGQINTALGLVVHVARDEAGRHYVVEIGEVRMLPAGITVTPIFLRDPSGAFIAQERPECWSRIAPFWSARSEDPFGPR